MLRPAWRFDYLLVLIVLCRTAPLRAQEAAQQPSILLRVCPALEADDVLAAVRTRSPDVEITLPRARVAPARWIIEACADETSATSTLTDTATGTTDPRTRSLPGQADPEEVRLLLVQMIEAQLATVREAPPAAVTAPPTPPDQAAAPPEPEEAPVALDVTPSVGFAAIGGLGDRMDAATIGLGPTVVVDLRVADIALAGLAVSAFTLVGTTETPAVEALPLEVRGGVEAEIGPVLIGGAVAAIAERWSPSGEALRSGWRGGIGVSGRLSVPVWRYLEFSGSLAVDFFPDSYAFGYFDDIIAELTNWRWRAAVGLSVRIPVR